MCCTVLPTVVIVASKGGIVYTVDPSCGNRQALDPDPSPWTPDGRSVKKIAGDWQALCTIEGTNGPDTIDGTNGDDVICGFDGDDEIDGRGGHDVLYGGPGKDTLTGGPAPTGSSAPPGDDTLNARDGQPDVVNGGPGKNAATTDAVDDVVDATLSPAERGAR